MKSSFKVHPVHSRIEKKFQSKCLSAYKFGVKFTF